MIWRILFALVSLTALGALLYLRQTDSEGVETVSGEPLNAEPGYVATHGDLVETGDNGHPLFRLDAERMEQPTPQGTIYLTEPHLDAEGRPIGSDSLMRIDTDALHLDMPQQLATTQAKVRVNWAGTSLRGRGMRFEMKRNYVELYAEVHATLAR